MFVLWPGECWLVCGVIIPENQVVFCILMIMVCVHELWLGLRDVYILAKM